MPLPQRALKKCDIFWGSHGCDRELDHAGRHVCKACCYAFGIDHKAGHSSAPDGYGFDGCAGDWPYYGSKHMRGATEHGLGFFRYKAPDWEFEYLPDEFDRMKELL